MRAPTEPLVECEVQVAASPETVFSFFTDPSKIVRWKGESARAVAMPGGVYHVDLGGGSVMEGKFVAVEPFTRIVFTFGWEGSHIVPPGTTTVEVTFERHLSGTRVRLRHFGLRDATLRATHEAGWRHYLARLAVAGAGGDPGPHRRPGS